MPNFKYESLTSSGQVRNGVLTATDRADAVRQLLSRGETATQVLPADAAAPRAKTTASLPRAAGGETPRLRFASRSARPTLGRAELATLIRELATALEAGLPLMQSLRTVRRQAAGKAMPVILDHLIDRVEAGDPLHVAARTYGPPFTSMIIGMMRAADASGEMSPILHQLADLLDRQLELRREVMGATLYPVIVVTLIAASVVVLVTVLVPRLIAPMAGQMTLPWPTRTLLGIAAFFQAYWIHCLLAAAALAFAWRLWSNVPANRFKVDRFKLQIPILGQLLRDVAIARFTRTLGTLTNAGLPILEALRITEGTLGNTALMQAVEEVQEQVTAGKSLAAPLERSGLFPPLLIQVVNLGERSGRLESMLLHAAGAFDRRVNTSLKM
ncbi:MAG: type II secretion system F family protein, partial [Planctomycetota bacterium]